MKRRKAKKPTMDDPFTRYLNDPKLIKALDDIAIKDSLLNLEFWTQSLKPGKFPTLDE